MTTPTLPDLSQAEIESLHRREWQEFRRALLIPAAASGDAFQAKYAKDIAAAIKTMQEAERSAWNNNQTDTEITIKVSWIGEKGCQS